MKRRVANGTVSNGVNRIFANKKNCGERFGTTLHYLKRSHLFNKTDLEQYLFKKKTLHLSTKLVERYSVRFWSGGLNLGPVKSYTVLPTKSPHSDISSKEAVLPAGAMTRIWATSTLYTLRRNTTSGVKNLIGFEHFT